MAFGETVECLAGNEVLGDLSFELDAMGAVPGHGFHPLKPGSTGQFLTCKLSTVRGALQGSVDRVAAEVGSVVWLSESLRQLTIFCSSSYIFPDFVSKYGTARNSIGARVQAGRAVD